MRSRKGSGKAQRRIRSFCLHRRVDDTKELLYYETRIILRPDAGEVEATRCMEQLNTKRARPVSPATARACVILSMVGVSLSAVFVRFSLAPSQTLAMLRMSLSALLLLVPVLLRHREELKLSVLGAKGLLRCGAGGLALGLHFFTYFEAIKNTSLASGLILVNTEVFFVALSLYVLYKEKLTRAGLLGVLMAFAGGAAVALGSLGNGTDTLYGNGMAVLSAICLCAYTLIGRSLRGKLSGTALSFTVYLGAAVVLGLVMLLTGEPLSAITTRDFLCALGMALCCTLLGHSVCLWALKYVPATFISVSRLLEPVFSSIWGIFLFAELPGAWQLAGGAVVMAGVAVYALWGERRPARGVGQNSPG